MKNQKHRRFLPTFLIVITLYLSNTVRATAAEPFPEPTTVSENTLPAEMPAVSENTLPANPPTVSPSEPSIISENTLPTASTASLSEPNAELDYVSSSTELTAWLNSHMYSGGRARLTANIAMDSPYLFVPYPNLPPLFVETDGYTIFVSADVELWSDGHLTFSGAGNAQGIFHVEKGGSLLLDGVTVEAFAENGDSSYALWQEEGASLTVGNTFAAGRIAGNIHYADTPFVTDTDPVCVIVEKGQSLNELLPTEITCRVNYQGACLDHAPIAVSWDMSDTQKQQDERQRFQAQGVFSQAQSHENPVCTVVYHDYPLTFTRADAFIRQSAYTFRGEYIKQEEMLAASTSPEYSFDGINWIQEGEHNTLSADAGFYISFPTDQWDTSAYPYIHIRLRAETGEDVYYSNVLRYAADRLNMEEDLGGSRGGGTNIVDPPADPEEPKTPTEPSKPVQSAAPDKPNQPSEPNQPVRAQSQEEPEPPQKQNTQDAAQNQTETPTFAASKDSFRSVTSFAPSAQTDSRKEPTDDKKPQDNTVHTTDFSAETSADNTAVTGNDDYTFAKSTSPPIELSRSPEDASLPSGEKTTSARQTETLILAAGFILLSAAGGAICFFVPIGKGGIQRRKSASSGGTKR